MSGGKKKHRKRNLISSESESSVAARKQRFGKNKKYILPLIVNTIVSLSVYLYLVQKHYFMVVLWVYFALALGFSAAYVIYNRAFTRRNLTPDMLPDSMTEGEKAEFIADGERRLEKSKWLLTVIFPLLMTFCIDLFNMYIVEPLLSGFGI